MKVFIKAYRVPIVLIIVGAAMAIAASLVAATRFYDYLFIIGILCLALGILSWALSESMTFLRNSMVRRRRLVRAPPRAAPPPQQVQMAPRGGMGRGPW